MEDISRELEREIAQARPKPYKQDRKTKILIVDDFGEIKSGEHLKTLVTILSFISIVCFLSSAILYFLYTGLSRGVNSTQNRLVLSEKKVEELTGEKEVLMARLVIAGKEPRIKEEPQKQERPVIPVLEDKKPLVSKNQEIKPIPSEPEEEEKIIPPVVVDQEEKIIEPQLNAVKESPEIQPETKEDKVIKKTISIEKFTVTKDRANKDLLVRFDIRNISTDGDVSGRIFTVLKPDNNHEEQWLVVPTSALKNGRPSEYKKGQYFSISHFKPVKFRIKNEADSDFYKKASIFIYNEQADLIFEELIDITEAE